MRSWALTTVWVWMGVASIAHAVDGHGPIEGMETPYIVGEVTTTPSAETVAHAWSRFQTSRGPAWRARFSPAGAFHDATGPGIELLSGAVTESALEAASRQLIDAHADLFGARSRDLETARVRMHPDGHAWVLLRQTVDVGGERLVVVDGYVKLHFSGGALVQLETEARAVPVETAPFELDAAAATQVALRDLRRYGISDLEVTTPATRVLHSRDAVAVSPAYELVVDTYGPRARFEMIVDGVTGEVLRRRNRIYYSVARLYGEVEPRQIGDAITVVPFIQTNGSGVTTNDDGLMDASGTFTATLTGPHARINDQAAAEATKSFDLTGGADEQPLYWRGNEAPIEQLDAWHYVNKAVARARFITPGLAWYDQQLPVNLNLNDTCNAFYDGSSLNFFRAGNGCNNTARMLDVVAHEWGHGFHDNRSIQGINAPEIQEGVADYIAVTLTNDPVLSPQFFTGGGAIRNVEPDRVYPDDFTGEVHDDGLVWGGAWWDLRKELIAKYGYAEGVYVSDVLHSDTLRGGPSITSAYQDALVADDDDNDITNGTPNSCEINRAFAAHGLVTNAVPEFGYVAFDHTPVDTGSPESQDIVIETAATAPSSCGALDASSLTLHYSVDGGASYSQVPLTASGGGYAVTIPAQKAGTLVKYYLSGTTTGSPYVYTEPARAPRSVHAFYVGAFEDVARYSFEDGLQGWTATATRALDQDWEVGVPGGGGWDPASAYEGVSALGNDLGVAGGDGMYPDGATSAVTSEVIDCSSCVGTRLQFHRFVNTAAGDAIRVRVNDTVVFEDTAGDLHDGQWLYDDIYIGHVADQNANVQITFEIAANESGSFGGWTLDDVAIVTSAASEGGPGDGGDGGEGPTNLNHLSGGCQCSVGPVSPASRRVFPAACVIALLAGVWIRRRRVTP